MQNFSKGRIAAGCVIGVVCGLVFPLLMLFSAWVLLIPIILAFLWVWAGWPAVLAGALSTAFAAYQWGGWGFVLAALGGLALPGVGAARLTDARKPFFRSVGYSVLIQWGALMAVTAIAWLLLRQNLVDVLTETLNGMLAQTPRYLQHFIVLQLGQAGMFGGNTGINFASAILTDAQLESLIAQLLSTINSGLKLMLPSYLISSGAATGALSYTVAAYVRVRRGDDPPMPYKKPETWRLAPDLIIGPPVMAALCVVLSRMNVAGADAAYVALINLTRLLMTVQAVGAFDRRLKASGTAPRRRAALITACVVFGQTLMPFVGAYSALFGSKGLISSKIRKRMDGKGEE